MSAGLERAVADVLGRDACSGCGLCSRLDASVRMELDARGYARPRFVGPPAPVPDAEALFRRGCPGIVVRSPAPPAHASRHALLGAHVGVWSAWSTDPAIRHAGSSGGALTALHAWLLESGRAARITGAGMDPGQPRRTVPVTILDREGALRAAGSRYAPVGALDNPDVLRGDSAVCAKPCEISALRQTAQSLVAGEPPLMLSFFCAGTPSQSATEALLAQLGIDPAEDLVRLRYRGDGWPGSFTAEARGRVVDADYATSWGRTLGPATQWRCKVCADGVGQSADIVSADAWESDEHGYPVFADAPGVSALIARTERGRRAILDAAAAGAIELAPLTMARLAAAQPLQVGRRRFLQARLWGSWLAGRRPPRYRGFPLLRLSAAAPRTALRALRGTVRRIRAAEGMP